MEGIDGIGFAEGVEGFDVMGGIGHGLGMDANENAGNGNAVQGNGQGHRLNWTPAMSGFVLRRFADLVGEGVRTDKGFKDAHVNQVARDLTEFNQEQVTGTEVYNHLRKWRAKWTKICRLKELSGAGWDEDNYMITLAPEHYTGHTKDHPKDAEFLNKPIIIYVQMQIIFGSGVATGRFAMGSNEPLGQPSQEPETIEVESDAPPATEDKPESQQVGKKRKRQGASEHEALLMQGMTDAIWRFAAAVTESSHSELAPGLSDAVLGVSGYSREALMHALNYLSEKKSTAMSFVALDEEDRKLWMRTYLSKNYYV